jgi:hypothetical protein
VGFTRHLVLASAIALLSHTASAIQIGSTAPDFRLTSLDGKPVSLADAAKSHTRPSW